LCKNKFARLYPEGVCYDCREKIQHEPYALNGEDIPRHLKKIGVGKRYIDSTLDNFVGGEQIIKYCRKWVENPCSLYLHGNYGCGKTHIATALCREIIKKKEMPKVRFVNASDLFLEIRSTFRPEGDSELSVVDKFCSRDFLFIDDLGADKTSDWSRATMYLIIDRRDREMLPTIITSNMNPKQLAENIDGRISSRLANGRIINIQMPDYRLKR
jgi:DNA replication protein DnaC